MALEPITRQEQIIAGKDLEPITRMERFLKEYGGGTGGGVSDEQIKNAVENYLDENPIGVDLSVTGATVGQVLKIAAVDANGKPTEWEAVDAPSGGGGEAWRLIKTITVAEDVAVIDAFTTDNDGNEFSLSAVKVVSDTAVLGESSTSTSGTIRVWVSKRDTINAGNNRDIMPSNAFIEPAFPNANVGLYAEMQKHDCVATMKTNVAGGSVNTIERTCYADANIERIAFQTGNPNALFIGAGSILYVWGIDA